MWRVTIMIFGNQLSTRGESRAASSHPVRISNGHWCRSKSCVRSWRTLCKPLAALEVHSFHSSPLPVSFVYLTLFLMSCFSFFLSLSSTVFFFNICNQSNLDWWCLLLLEQHGLLHLTSMTSSILSGITRRNEEDNKKRNMEKSNLYTSRLTFRPSHSVRMLLLPCPFSGLYPRYSPAEIPMAAQRGW